LDYANKYEKDINMKISNEKLCIGIPCSFPMVSVSFFYSFLYMERPNFVLVHADNGPVDALRNNIVEKALSVGATKLIMMDADMGYHPKTIPTLLAHRLPIVGALCSRRYPPFDSIMLKITDAGYQSINEWKDNELVEVDATGAGCIMYDMEVFRKMPRPWFRFRTNPDTGEGIGEDVGFCQDLKMAGYKIYVDTSVPADHLTIMAVNHNTHRLYEQMKRMQFGALDRAMGEQQTI
jgi:hypothetical protein